MNTAHGSRRDARFCASDQKMAYHELPKPDAVVETLIEMLPNRSNQIDSTEHEDYTQSNFCCASASS